MVRTPGFHPGNTGSTPVGDEYSKAKFMELSLPAGNIECAISAFNGGADSVYLGLKEFSARKSAENFSFDDLRRLKEYTQIHNKKFYIALNTIVTDNELNDVYKILKKLEYISPNGIIVQDLGIVNIVKKHFSSLELHASTQTAAKTIDDIRVLKALGFKRAVLAREMSIDEIKAIRDEEKDMELKVFIHGAMCYSLSGRCYACERITNKRSANRGDCIGICRWKWEDETGKKAHFFSLSDLVSDRETIRALKNAGIDALKVEGRLKNESYTYETARYYRSLIDNDKENEDLKHRAMAAFSRKSSSGFFYKDEKEFKSNLECSEYVGHRGYKCGEFINKRDVKLLSNVEKHDGLMFIDRIGNEHKFTLKDNRTIHLKNEILKDIAQNNESWETNALYKIKEASSSIKKINKNSIDPYMEKRTIRFVIENSHIQADDTIIDFEVQKAEKKQNIKQNILNVFKTKEGLIYADDITLYNKCHITDINDIYIPLSILKKLKNEYYKAENKKLLDSFEEHFTPTHLPPNNSEQNYDISKYKTINYLRDLKGYIDKTETKDALISPLMNSANSECVSLLKALCSPCGCIVQAIGEKSIQKDIPECIEKTDNSSIPIFISYAPFPKDGIYKTEVLGRKIRVKTERKDDITYTYLLDD